MASPENALTLATQDEELAVRELIHDLIARRAYEIWEREGKAEDLDQQHWFQAIAELTYDPVNDEDDDEDDEDAAVFGRKRILIC
jgi:hypothetical protein